MRAEALIVYLWLLCGALTGCGGSEGGGIAVSPLPPLGPVTISPADYLSGPTQQADPIRSRRFDFGHFQANDAFRLPDGSAILAWSYAPFGPFDAALGDGGERYVVENGTVRIDSTQDGGTPGVQYFVGAACGGTGWVAFRADATAAWQTIVAHLDDHSNPSQCDAANAALTRYERATVTYPVLGPVDTVVSEHYDSGSLASATALERAFYALGYGRLVWQRWGPTPPTIDLSARCPDFGWNTSPVAGWHLDDCREAVTTEPADGSLTGADLWRPPNQ